MDDNASPHRSREVTAYLQREAMNSLPWQVMKPDLNAMKHVFDTLGRRVQAVGPHVHNVRREWRQLPQQCIPQQYIRQLTEGITRNVEAVIQARGGCSRY